MFKCQLSKKTSKSGEKQFKIVLEARNKDYFGPLKDEEGKIVRNSDGVVVLTKVGNGNETVKEISVCEEEYNKYLASQGIQNG